jgi:hypothetical protein
VGTVGQSRVVRVMYGRIGWGRVGKVEYDRVGAVG